MKKNNKLLNEFVGGMLPNTVDTTTVPQKPAGDVPGLGGRTTTAPTQPTADIPGLGGRTTTAPPKPAADIPGLGGRTTTAPPKPADGSDKQPDPFSKSEEKSSTNKRSGKISAAVRRCKNRIHFPCPKDNVFKYGCIDPDDQGNVGMIQRCLMQVGDGNKELPIYGDDGRFCAETKKAVQKFQLKNSLSDTGVVDRATSDMLFKQCKSSTVKDKEADKKPSGDAPGGVGKGSFTYTGSGWENTVIGTGLGTLTAVSSGIAMKDDEPNVVIKTVDDIKKTNKYKDLKKVSVGIEKGEGAKKSHAGEIKKDFEGFTEELFEKIEDYNKDSSKLKELNSFLKEELEAEKQKTTPDDETIEYNRKKVIFIEYLLKKYSISESKINKNFISHIKNRNDMLEKLIFERLVKNANRLR